MHFYLENPPQDQTERWNGRPFRSYSIVHPPSSVNLDPVRTEADKKIFLDNLWNAQASLRTKAGQSVALRDEEREVESKGGRITVARTYYNVYQRTAFLKEPKKVT
jgi:protein ECT2